MLECYNDHGRYDFFKGDIEVIEKLEDHVNFRNKYEFIIIAISIYLHML